MKKKALSKAEEKLGCFPHVSKGWVIKYDITKKPNERIQSITFEGKPISDTDEFTIAATDYVLNGGDGLSAFKNSKIQKKENISVGQVVLKYLQNMGVINYKKEGRIVELSRSRYWILQFLFD